MVRKYRSDYIGNKSLSQVNKFAKFFYFFFNLYIVSTKDIYIQYIEPLTLHKFIHKM